MKKVLGALMLSLVLVGSPVAVKAQVVENPNQALIESLQAQINILIELVNQMIALQEQEALMAEADDDDEESTPVYSGPTGTIDIILPYSPAYVDTTGENRGGVNIKAFINDGNRKNTVVYLDTPEGTLNMQTGAAGGKWRHHVAYWPTSAGEKTLTFRVPEFNISETVTLEIIHQEWVD